VEAALAWTLCGPWWGVGVGVFAPATGYAALLWGRGRAHTPPGVKAEIVAARRTERARLREDIARHLEARAPRPGADEGQGSPKALARPG